MTGGVCSLLFCEGLSAVNAALVPVRTTVLYQVLCWGQPHSYPPVNEAKLCSFVARLADEHLKHRTIKVYLSAVRHLQISEGLPDPFHGAGSLPKLHYVLQGIKKHEAEVGSGTRERHPVTPCPAADPVGVGADGN